MLRRPRFQRSNDAPSIHLTERDLEIIRHVHKHRFLRSTHIRKLVGGSSNAVLRRLQLLFHHGYLDRPRAQIDYYRSGSRPIVYGIGNNGARELDERFGGVAGKIEWRNKNRCVTRLYLEHALAIADVMIAIEISCRENPSVQLIDADQFTGNDGQWKVTARYKGKSVSLGVIPDAMFAFKCAGDPRKTALVFVEADRATMPVTRQGLRQTSFFRKMVAYQESWQQKLHTSLFGFNRCLVLTVTTTLRRVANLIEASATLNDGRGSGLFLFTDQESLAASTNVFTLPFRNGRNETVRLAV